MAWAYTRYQRDTEISRMHHRLDAGGVGCQSCRRSGEAMAIATSLPGVARLPRQALVELLCDL